jgi:cation:H+ antiporter
VVVFVLAAALSLGGSALLVTRLERIGERLGLTEAMLGLLAALAADGPEITSSITAMARGQGSVGVGVVFGSNAFNLAALLGLSAILAGRIAFHRRVVLLEGSVAAAMVVISAVVLLGAVPAAAGLAIALLVLLPYLLVSGVRRRALQELPVSRWWNRWLLRALSEEEEELSAAIRPRRGQPVDAVVAGAALAVVIGASIVMEHSGTAFGDRHDVPGIVIGGLLLAVVTSLPNAVAGIYLAGRGRGAATLSVALNSNTLNVVVGFLVPASIAGFAAGAAGTVLTLAAYAGLTAFTLVTAYVRLGLGRIAGAAIVAGYGLFVALLLLQQ